MIVSPTSGESPPPRDRQNIQQPPPALQLIDPWLAYSTQDADGLASKFFHPNADLRIAKQVPSIERGELALDLRGRQSLDANFTDKGKRYRSLLGHDGRLTQFVDFENGDLDNVSRADPIRAANTNRGPSLRPSDQGSKQQHEPKP